MKNEAMQQEQFERIEAYLLHRMTAGEKERFEQEMKTDPLLEKEVKELRTVFTGIGEAEMGRMLEKFHREEWGAPVKKMPARRSLKWIWGVAAGLLLAFAGGWWWQYRENAEERLFSRYYKPDPGLMTVMGNTDMYAFNKAMVDFKSGNYEAALAEWELMLKSDPANDTLCYFAGSASLAMGKLDEAAGYLNRVLLQVSSTFYRDACWYAALVHVKQGNVRQAEQLLKGTDHAGKDDLISDLQKYDR